MVNVCDRASVCTLTCTAECTYVRTKIILYKYDVQTHHYLRQKRNVRIIEFCILDHFNFFFCCEEQKTFGNTIAHTPIFCGSEHVCNLP